MNYRFPHVAWNLDCAKHLLSRTEFSADEKRVQALSQMSMEAAVESIQSLAYHLS